MKLKWFLAAMFVIAIGTAHCQTPTMQTTTATCQTEPGVLVECHPVALKPAPVAAVPRQHSFVLIGTTGTVSTAPHAGGFGAFGTPIGSDKLSWTMYQSGFTSGKPVSSMTEGAAQRACQMTLGTVLVKCWLIGSLGAGQTGTASTLALNGGGGVSFEGLSKRWPDLFGFAGVLENKQGSLSQARVLASLGWRF